MNWYNKSKKEVEDILNTNLERGLTDERLKNAQEKYGKNEIQAKRKKSIFVKFLEQFKDFMIIILIIAAIISGVVGSLQGEGITDTIIILIVVIVNAIIGVAQENKAEKSLEALQKLSAHTSRVIRNGKLMLLPSSELVPGDLVILETGDYISADLRIIEAVNLKVQESALTGESMPVEKTSDTIKEENIGVGDRINMLFSSSLVTYGRGKGIVVETGMNTEVGKIAGIISNTEKNETPLQIKLNSLGKTLGIVAVCICLVIFVIGLLQKKDPIQMLMTSVSLAVAAIPEGLAAVSTIVLAIGVQRMVKKNAIVKHLPAVETLGSSTVICSDKTGTLTQNKMTVQKLYYNGKLVDINETEKDSKSEQPQENNPIGNNAKNNIKNNELNKLVYASILCNDTKIINGKELAGDPTETALIDMGIKLNYSLHISAEMPRVKEIPFDSERKLMTTVHEIQKGSKYIVYTKGGIDELLNVCNSYLENGKIEKGIYTKKEEIKNSNEIMAKEALRVLGMAYKELNHLPTKEEMKTIENDLTFIGMVGMIDPPREEAKKAVEKCKLAGIKPVMITGDHKLTAMAIAKKLGILQDEKEALTGADLEKISDEELAKNVSKYSVYARVSPEHKVKIVKAWQKNNQIVAMTGDGVNDAPALKTADIGCAMGVVGTDVAKEAADVILTDDNFATIVLAVEEGRRIYDNILKAIQFLLSSNIGELIVLFVATLITPILASAFGILDINSIEPLLPIHILWINLVTDSLPALALAFDPAAKNIMNRKPIKSSKGVFTKGMTWRIVYQGIMIGIITLLAFIIGLATTKEPLSGLTLEQTKIEVAQTMAFVVLAFSELIHVFNIRNNKESIFKTGIFGNPKLILSIMVSACLMLVILAIPSLRHVFSIPILPMQNILEIVILIFSPIIIVELFKLLKINTTKDEEA